MFKKLTKFKKLNQLIFCVNSSYDNGCFDNVQFPKLLQICTFKMIFWKFGTSVPLLVDHLIKSLCNINRLKICVSKNNINPLHIKRVFDILKKFHNLLELEIEFQCKNMPYFSKKLITGVFLSINIEKIICLKFTNFATLSDRHNGISMCNNLSLCPNISQLKFSLKIIDVRILFLLI